MRLFGCGGLLRRTFWGLATASLCGRLRTFGVLLCALVVLVVGISPSALAATNFGESGEEAAQLRGPKGAATDAAGDVYVSDGQNHRIDKFNQSGGFQLAWGQGVANGASELQTCTATCEAGYEGGAVGFPSGIAVDNELSSLSNGDVYEVDSPHTRVQKFDPTGKFIWMIGGHVNETTGANLCLSGEKCREGYAELGTGEGEFSSMPFPAGVVAVGPGGRVYVGDRARVEVFEPSGVWREDISLTGLSSEARPTALAVDSAGDVFVYDNGTFFGGAPGVLELEPNGTEKAQFDEGSISVTGLAVDSSGHLYVGDSNGGFHVVEYEVAPKKELASFGSNTVSGVNHGIAFSSATGDVYAPDNEANTIWTIPVPPPGPLIVNESAVPGLHGAATLRATVNPENHETNCHFEYGTTTSYGQSASCSTSLVANFENGNAEAQLPEGMLAAGAIYHYRVVATDSLGNTSTGEDQSFEETPPAVIEGPWATEVEGDSANLSVKIINSQQTSTEYRLEYGTSISNEQPVATGILAATEDAVVVSHYITGLELNTTYHYRVVASNITGKVEGSDHAFTTQLTGGGLTLSDGRMWELVSPANKRGALIEPSVTGQEDIQAATDGSGITYPASQPVTEHPPASAGAFVISTRGSAGWNLQEIMPSQQLAEGTTPNGSLLNGATPPLLFSPDLSSSVIEPWFTVPPSQLSPEATERTIFLHDTAGGTWTPLVTPANVETDSKFGGERSNSSDMEFLGANPDLSHIVFESEFALTTGATSGVEECEVCELKPNLYEWSAGHLAQVNVLPEAEGGKPSLPHAFLGRNQNADVVHTISDDGRWVVWNYEASGRDLFYVRDMVDRKTVKLGGNRATFETMSSDGSRIFYLEDGNLEMLDTATDAVKNLTANHSAEERSAGVQDAVLGTSEDGTYVYFVATGILAGKAVRGGDNLYIAHEENGTWRTSLIATLSSEDEKSWSGMRLGIQSPARVTSRVSPSGRFVAFMSNRSLTGYDNTDAISKQPDEEVYLYDAQAERENRQPLICVSCNPTGARPVGLVDNGPLVDRAFAWAGHWLAGSIPGWRTVQSGRAEYQPRNLSDSGRLFFESPDGIVPQATNGLENVYEYEPLGTGGEKGCSTSSPTFSQRSNGCVSLISSGDSGAESAFYDASKTGDDAFFIATTKLVGADYDGSYDVYDAHVCSISAPCHVEPVHPLPCGSGDSCKVAPSPQPEIFGPAPSMTFSGQGNVKQSKLTVSPKSLTAAEKLKRALRTCRKKKSRHKRVVCERRARKRYSAKRVLRAGR